jgi:hypothetical protein
MGVVDQNVMNTNRQVAIPRGSNADPTLKQLSSNELVLDLESVTVNKQRYAVTMNDAALGTGSGTASGRISGPQGSSGGGVLLGAIAGGGKGAAMGVSGNEATRRGHYYHKPNRLVLDSWPTARDLAKQIASNAACVGRIDNSVSGLIGKGEVYEKRCGHLD